MDWLELYNPDINWVTKQLTVHKGDQVIALQGQQNEAIPCEHISVLQLKQLLQQKDVDHMVFVCDEGGHSSEEIPSSVQAIVDEFQSIFF